MCGRYRLSQRKQIIEEYFDTVPWDGDWKTRQSAREYLGVEKFNVVRDPSNERGSDPDFQVWDECVAACALAETHMRFRVL